MVPTKQLLCKRAYEYVVLNIHEAVLSWAPDCMHAVGARLCTSQCHHRWSKPRADTCSLQDVTLDTLLSNLPFKDAADTEVAAQHTVLYASFVLELKKQLAPRLQRSQLVTSNTASKSL